MPGNAKPNRERSKSGKWQHKYNELRLEYIEKKKEYDATRLIVAKYQEAINQLAVSASQSARRVGVMTQIALTCRKHFAKEPHHPTCHSLFETDAGPCDCSHDAILDSIDTSLAEPDFEPEKVKIEIKDADDTVMEVPSETVGLATDTLSSL